MSNNTVPGAKFTPRSVFRPTGMSVAMAAGGVIPGHHMVRELSCTARLRHRNDTKNTRQSAYVSF